MPVRRLLNLGLDEHSPPPLVKRIRLTNAMSMFCIVVLVGSIPFDAATAPPWMLAEDVLGALLYAGFLRLNRGRRYLASRTGLIAVSNLIVFGNAILLGRESGAQLVLLALTTLPFALFDFEERRWQAMSVALSLVAFGLVESGWLATLQDRRPDFVPDAYYPYSVSVMVASLLFVMFQVSRANRDAEQALRQTRETAAQAAKMAALGQMSGGIAHEVNNPLLAIVMRAGQLRKLASSGRLDPKRVDEVATHIEAVADRIKRIVGALRSFARSGEQDPPKLERLDAIVRDTLELCQGRFHRGEVKLDVDPISERLEATCRAVDVSQVLLNLLNNAFDAVEGTPGAWVRLSIATRADAIEIAITDSGTGIPEHVQARLMEPFFTTKPFGRGTGLGLSISKGLAEINGGSLALDPHAPNTRFVLTLQRPA